MDRMRYEIYLRIPGRNTRITALVEGEGNKYSLLDHKLQRGMPLTPGERPVGFISLPDGVNNLGELVEGTCISSETVNHRPGGELDGYEYCGCNPYHS